MVEPAASILEPLGLEPEQVPDRPLQANRRWMKPTEGGEATVRAIERSDRQNLGGWFEERDMHGLALTPEAEQLETTGGEQPSDRLPDASVDPVPCPGSMLGNDRSAGQELGEWTFEQGGEVPIHPSWAAIAWNQRTSGSGSQMPASSTRARCANMGT